MILWTREPEMANFLSNYKQFANKHHLVFCVRLLSVIKVFERDGSPIFEPERHGPYRSEYMNLVEDLVSVPIILIATGAGSQCIEHIKWQLTLSATCCLSIGVLIHNTFQLSL